MADHKKKGETSLLTHPLYSEVLQEHVIRLIEIQPGDHDSSVITRLFIVELDYTPDYEVISYMWGDRESLVKIRCNGRTLDITNNLDNALRRVRYPDRPRLIWAGI
jgi:hypothetical protein